MLAKISAEVMKAIGAESASEVDSQMSAFIAEANKNKASMAENQVTLQTLQASVTALEGKLGNLLTEARVKEICGTATTEAIKAWATSDEGKKIIGAEASKIALDANAAIGTQPAKPAPAPAAGGTSEDQAKTLIAAGKYEEAYALLPAAEKADFVSAKNYAAYMRNRGNTKITARD